MALNITSQVTTFEGFELPTSYARVSVRDDEKGEQLVIGLSFYASEAAFTAGSQSFSLKNPDPLAHTPFAEWTAIPYDRATDGTDILSLAHDYCQFRLDSIGVSSEIVL